MRIFTSKNYDPRWFIWTIVLLLAIGLGLVSYITYTSAVDEQQSVSLVSEYIS